MEVQDEKKLLMLSLMSLEEDRGREGSNEIGGTLQTIQAFNGQGSGGDHMREAQPCQE